MSEQSGTPVVSLLDREAILGHVGDIETREVSVPEWGGKVRVRGLTASERDDFEASLVRNRNGKREVNTRNSRARLLTYGLIDADGNKLFKPADIETLGELPGSIVDKLTSAIQELSYIGDDDIEELEGN